MQKSITLIVTVVLWAASMFIKLEEYYSRGELVRIYVYSSYFWIIAVFHDPERALTQSALMACAAFVIIDLFHIGLCFVISVAFIWIVRKLYSVFYKRSSS